eukprot:5835143-Prymnesium_polylepis.1
MVLAFRPCCARLGGEAELSGATAPPDGLDPSSPALKFTLHPIGGFCAISKTLPLPERTTSEFVTPAAVGNGMNPQFHNETSYEAMHTLTEHPPW